MSENIFQIDWDQYRIVDLSYEVVPNKESISGRPFYAMRSDTLPDGKDTEAVFTHTHVGTHVETVLHFFREGKTITDYSLDKFMGEALLFSIDDREEGHLAMDYEYLNRKWDDAVKKGDIVVWRNDSPSGQSGDNIPHPEEEVPYFTPDAARFFVEKETKMIVMGKVSFGKDIEKGNEFEGELHEAEIPIVEMPANLEQLERERFFLMALPIKVKGVGSAWARAIAIEER